MGLIVTPVAVSATAETNLSMPIWIGGAEIVFIVRGARKSTLGTA
jgi:hypothetical protein